MKLNDQKRINELLENGNELYTKSELESRVDNYLRLSVSYLYQPLLEQHINEEVVRKFLLQVFGKYVEDIKNEVWYFTSRLTKEMSERSCETEEQFVNSLVEDAMKNTVNYFKLNYGDLDGIDYLIEIGGIDIDSLVETIKADQDFDAILGVEIEELLDADGETLFFVM